MNNTVKTTLLAAACCLALGGCATAVDTARDDSAVIGSDWSGALPILGRAADNATWWNRWNDAELDTLLKMAAKSNTDVLVAAANLRSAAALADQAAAELYPTLGINAQGSGNRAGSNNTNESWSAKANGAWSFNLAGGNLASRRAADFEAAASSMTLDDVRVGVAAEVATQYVNLKLARVKLESAKKNLANYEKVAEIAGWRYRAGLVGKAEFDQAVSNRESARAQIPVVESSIAKYRNALARLVACNVADLPVGNNAVIPKAPDDIAVSIPARVLENRPDISAARASVLAAAERIAEAKAQLWPKLEISGNLGTQAATLSALGTSGTGVAALVGAISMPIFNWNVQVTATEQRRAALDKAQANYTATLLKALEQTQNALAGLTAAQQRARPLEAALQAAQSSFDITSKQYETGLVDYQTVLTSQRTLISAEESVQSNTADNSLQLVALYRALGGGWKPGK